MLRVSINDLFAFNMRKVVLQNFLWEQVNKGLNVFSHLFFGLGFLQRTEINVGESSLEKLNVELIWEENCDVIDGLLNSEICKYLVTEVQNGLNY